MRKVIISLAAAGTALAFATPATAQYWPQPQQAYGYGASYGYGQGSYRQARVLQARIDRIQGDLDRLAQRRAITRNEYQALHGDSHRIEQRLRAASRYGLGQRERYDIERRIARLEQRIAYEVRDGRGWNQSGDYHGSNGYYGQSAYSSRSGYGYDEDRDGRDDRYEDDRGHDHDDD